MTPKIAIIGAGISGIAAARQLTEVADVRVFEKARGLGGRLATRRRESFAFDHGGQFFTARSEKFRHLVNSFSSDIVQPWRPKIVTLEQGRKTFKREWFEDHFVALPGSNGMVKAMAADLSVQTATRVGKLEHRENRWRLLNDEQESLGEFDWIISAAPAPQTLALMPDVFARKAELGKVQYSACFALMLGFAAPLALDFDAAVVRGEPIGWLAVNNSKPGRSQATSLLVHSDNEWAGRHLEHGADAVTAALLASLAQLTDIDGNTARYNSLHRWRYAKVETALQCDHLLDATHRLAACGDWCLGNRVEDAFLSGESLGKRLQELIQ